jgi:chaperone BCS1
MDSINKYVGVDINSKAFGDSPIEGRHSVHVILDREKQKPTAAKFISYAFNMNTVIGEMSFNEADLLQVLWKHTDLTKNLPLMVSRVEADSGEIVFDRDADKVLIDEAPACWSGPAAWTFNWKGTPCSYTAKSIYYYLRVHVLDHELADDVISEILNEMYKLHLERQKLIKRPPYVVKLYRAMDKPHTQWVQANDRAGRDLASIHLDDSIKQDIVVKLEKFLASQDLYEKFGITWKRVHLFEGRPGTGKTSMVLALATKFGVGVSKITITPRMSSVDLENLLSTVPGRSFLLLEDVDALFAERKAGEAGSTIDFSTLLNCLDGVTTRAGLVAFLTTNHADRLDEALVRPGRIDMRVKFPYPTEVELRAALDRLVPQYATEHTEFLRRLLDDKKEISIARLQRYLFDCVLLDRKSLVEHMTDLHQP